jgi:glycosyltransferase involved in cell wall biosynthesis
MRQPPHAVVIDYTPAVRQQAGIGRIIRGQVQALIGAAPGYDLRLFVVGRVDAQARAAAPLPLHTTPLSERTMVRLWHRLDSPLPPVEWFTGGPIDLLHATDFVLLPSKARRKLLTVHDLAFLFHPDAAMPSLHHYLNVVVPRSVRRADGLIADSHHTARDLTEQWQVPPERITVVQGAVDRSRFQPVTDPQRLAAVRARYGIGDGPFILGLSRLEPRKNFVRLIEAFAAARTAAKLPHHLVIGGGKGWLYDTIFARVQELRLGDLVHFPASSPTMTWPRSTAPPTSSPIRHSTKVSACRSWKRWPAERLCSRRTTPVSPKRAARAHSMFTPKMWRASPRGWCAWPPTTRWLRSCAGQAWPTQPHSHGNAAPNNCWRPIRKR